MRLELERFSTGYGQTTIVRELSLAIGDGEAVAVVGRNGMGKSTLLKGVLGYLDRPGGSVRLDGDDISRWPTFRIVRRGVAYSPQEQAIVANLSVGDNLTSGTLTVRSSAGRRAQVLDYFPLLGRRLRQPAGTLSGGEQKMLILARALLAEPQLLVLDEISAGLQPSVCATVIDALTSERSRRRLTILMVEQNLDMVLRVTDRVAVMKLGILVWEGPAREDSRDRLTRELSL
jgi:ABC-type branched-subunit amino acid transport system ATPase component